jgi:CRP/FNR family transcriptional regulator, cyclic AMP receptor protein
VIRSGQVQIVLPSPGGEEVILGVLDAGACFGEMALLDGQPRSATIVATAPTETLVIGRDAFRAAVLAHPRIAIDLLQLVAGRLRETDALVADATFLDIAGRLAKRLLELADVYGSVGADGTVIGMRLTQSALAAMVGATRESVNKHLRAFAAQGSIVVGRQRITIRRPDELRRRIA